MEEEEVERMALGGSPRVVAVAWRMEAKVQEAEAVEVQVEKLAENRRQRSMKPGLYCTEVVEMA